MSTRKPAIYCNLSRVQHTGVANVPKLWWPPDAYPASNMATKRERVEHLSHQWHIKTITDSVWREILQDNTRHSSLCAFKSSWVFTEACPTDFPCPWHQQRASLGGKRAHRPAPVIMLCHIPQLPASLGLTAIWLAFDAGQGRSPPAPRRRPNPQRESGGKVILSSFSPASTIWLVKQIALSSCSPIFLLSQVSCAAAAAPPRLPPPLRFCSDAISTAIRAAPVSGESPRHQFDTFAVKNLRCSLQAAVHLNASITQTFCSVIRQKMIYLGCCNLPELYALRLLCLMAWRGISRASPPGPKYLNRATQWWQWASRRANI